jgi:hypothetical protein
MRTLAAITIAVANLAHAPGLPRVERAIQAQSQVFARVWRVRPVRFTPGGAYRVTLTTDPTAVPPGYDGWHDVVNGAPSAIVIVHSTPVWEVMLDHEVLEMLVDPWADGQPEVCDGVDLAWYGAPGGVTLSDFTYPAWWRAHAHGPYDYLHVARRPGDATDGYVAR